MMDANYQDLQCADLKHILKSKGIPFSNKRKQDLVELCESADALNSPGIYQNDSEKKGCNQETDGSGKTIINIHVTTLESYGVVIWLPSQLTIPVM